MDNVNILVVEDQIIVSKDIQLRLQGMGYSVVGSAVSGEEAIQRSHEARPDLVLMDVILKGHVDGIQAAQTIQEQLGIPVIYLTAHSDDSTLDRAKLTEPGGYILKPFEDRALRAAIKLALFRHQGRRGSPARQ